MQALNTTLKFVNMIFYLLCVSICGYSIFFVPLSFLIKDVKIAPPSTQYNQQYITYTHNSYIIENSLF